MSKRHYFTHSFMLDSGGDGSNLPAQEDLSIAVEGIFFSAYPQSSPVGPAQFTVTGLRGTTAGQESGASSFYYDQSSTEVVNTHFPIRGKTNEGVGVGFTLSASSEGSQATGQATVWGYYTDED